MSIYKTLTPQQMETLLFRTTSAFNTDIIKQNQMYRLPINKEPTMDNLTRPNGVKETAETRMMGFLKTLSDEIAEGVELRIKASVIDALENGDAHTEPTAQEYPKLAAFVQLAETNLQEAKKVWLTEMADWLADMTVYIRSEAMKYGIPLEMVQQVVMGSNFTKLPSDGVPIHDENGKFLKDMTNYVPPEDGIYTVMFHSADCTNGAAGA